MNLSAYINSLLATLHKHRKQAMQYGVVGIMAVIADYVAFVCLLGLVGLPLGMTTVVSQLAGFVVSFSLNRLWVFKASGERAHSSTAWQLIMYTILFFANTAFTYLFVRLWVANDLSPYIAKLVSIGLITTWNFALFRLVIFKTKPPMVRKGHSIRISSRVNQRDEEGQRNDG